jgi:hypothetical protein
VPHLSASLSAPGPLVSTPSPPGRSRQRRSGHPCPRPDSRSEAHLPPAAVYSGWRPPHLSPFLVQVSADSPSSAVYLPHRHASTQSRWAPQWPLSRRASWWHRCSAAGTAASAAGRAAAPQRLRVCRLRPGQSRGLPQSWAATLPRAWAVAEAVVGRGTASLGHGRGIGPLALFRHFFYFLNMSKALHSSKFCVGFIWT